MNRRAAIELSDNEDDFPEQNWETEGSGLMNASADKYNQSTLRVPGLDQGWKQFNKTSRPGYFSA